jgi:hypothetical protein
MYALSLIKGPLVNDWANDQVTELRNKVTCAQNPIGRDREVLGQSLAQLSLPRLQTQLGHKMPTWHLCTSR